MNQYKVETSFGKVINGKVEVIWNEIFACATERKAWAFVNKVRNCGQLRVMKNDNGEWIEIQ